MYKRQDKTLAEQEVRAYMTLNQPQAAMQTAIADDNDPQAALLTLETIPWAQLTIDGVDVGLMTPVEVRLKPGRHTLRLRNPALAVDRELPLQVAPGDHAKMRLTL